MRGWGPKKAASLFALLALIALSWVSVAQACVICIPYPKVTHADQLLDSDVVALARENPDKPFSYAVTEVLKGKADDQPSQLFVDTQTRRRLHLNPDDRVVLYRPRGEAQWRRLAYADVAYQEVITAILAHSESWRPHGTSPERVAYFSRLLNSAQRTIRAQAYLEVGRAPYAQIREVAGLVSREEMRGFLADWRLIEWHRLYILMLANSGHPDDQAFIRKKFERAAQSGVVLNLAAWTVALIESHPQTAMEEIEDLYFRKSGRSFEELEAVLQGLSVAAAHDGAMTPRRIANLRRRTIKSYAALLDGYPQMAGHVARDLTIWQEPALVDRLAAISDAKLLRDPGAAFAVDLYLSAAPGFATLREIN